MKNIGFYLELPPKTVLTGEGMGRVFAQILKGLTSHGYHVILTLPFWLQEEVNHFLALHDIILSSITLFTLTSSASITDFVKPTLQQRLISTIKRIIPYRTKAFIKKILISFGNKTYRTSNSEPIAIKANDKLVNMDSYFIDLVAAVNKENFTHTWILPSFTYVHGFQLNGKIFTLIPDCVYSDFFDLFKQDMPELLSYWLTVCEPAFRAHRSNIAGVISFNQDVRQRHVIDYFGIHPDKTYVVKHATIRHDLILNKINADLKVSAHITLRGFVKNRTQQPTLDWLLDQNIPYFIYTTQDRPHKNIINLVDAYARVLKQHAGNCKLILTTPPRPDTPLSHYIKKLNLQNEILQVGRIDAATLAAFYAQAHCAINPSLFEGGFPFTFSEALSVGTPCIMSDIACVREEIEDPAICKIMLFDPKNITAIANMMLNTFSQRAQLLTLQRPIYEKMQMRSDTDVANDYAQIFNINTVASC